VKLNVLFTYFLAVAGFFALSACSPATAQVITPGGDVISIEIALTQEEKANGLMGREHLPENSGMLFVFDSPQPLSFWMKNTLIPLDVLYLDEAGTIVDIKTMQPCPPEEERCPSYPSGEPARYALEINGGRAQELELEIGDSLKILGLETPAAQPENI
jgi:uncharacterized membrane protein (UPF0127 family)